MLKKSQVLKEGFNKGLKRALTIIEQMINEDITEILPFDMQREAQSALKWNLKKADIEFISDYMKDKLKTMSYEDLTGKKRTLTKQDVKNMTPIIDTINSEANQIRKETHYRAPRKGLYGGAEKTGSGGTGWALTIRRKFVVDNDPNYIRMCNSVSNMDCELTYGGDYWNLVKEYCRLYVVMVHDYVFAKRDNRIEAFQKKYKVELADKNIFNFHENGVDASKRINPQYPKRYEVGRGGPKGSGNFDAGKGSRWHNASRMNRIESPNVVSNKAPDITMDNIHDFIW